MARVRSSASSSWPGPTHPPPCALLPVGAPRRKGRRGGPGNTPRHSPDALPSIADTRGCGGVPRPGQRWRGGPGRAGRAAPGAPAEARGGSKVFRSLEGGPAKAVGDARPASRVTNRLKLGLGWPGVATDPEARPRARRLQGHHVSTRPRPGRQPCRAVPHLKPGVGAAGGLVARPGLPRRRQAGLPRCPHLRQRTGPGTLPAASRPVGPSIPRPPLHAEAQTKPPGARGAGGGTRSGERRPRGGPAASGGGGGGAEPRWPAPGAVANQRAALAPDNYLASGPARVSTKSQNNFLPRSPRAHTPALQPEPASGAANGPAPGQPRRRHGGGLQLARVPRRQPRHQRGGARAAAQALRPEAALQQEVERGWQPDARQARQEGQPERSVLRGAAESAHPGQRARAPAHAVAQRGLRGAAQDHPHAALGQAEQDPDAQAGRQVHRLPLPGPAERRNGQQDDELQLRGPRAPQLRLLRVAHGGRLVHVSLALAPATARTGARTVPACAAEVGLGCIQGCNF